MAKAIIASFLIMLVALVAFLISSGILGTIWCVKQIIQLVTGAA